MAFETLATLVQEAEVEQQEYDTANQALEGARGELITAQAVVVDKQAAVDAARDTATGEKNDVIAKLQALLTEVQNQLAILQG